MPDRLALADRRKPGGLVVIGGRSSQIHRRCGRIDRRDDQIHGRRAGGGPLEAGSAIRDSGASGGWWGFAGDCRRGAAATGAEQAGSSEGLKSAARQHASGQQGAPSRWAAAASDNSSRKQQRQEQPSISAPRVRVSRQQPCKAARTRTARLPSRRL